MADSKDPKRLEDVNPYELSAEKWAFVLRSNAVLNGFIIQGSKDAVQRSRFPAFQLNHEIADFSAFDIEDNSSINVSIISSDFQHAIAEECFSTKDFEAVLKASILGFGLAGDIEKVKASVEQSSNSVVSTTSRLHATYEFPRVVLFLDEHALEPSPQCRKALDVIVADPTAEAVTQFLDRFGHIYPREIHLGGRLQATKSLDSVSGKTVNEKVEILKLEASGQFNPGFARGSGKYHGIETESMLSRLTVSGSSQMMAWEARGGDTTISSNPSAWASTVKASHNWRVIRRKGLIPLPELLGLLPEWKHIPTVFADAISKATPQTLPPPTESTTSLQAQNRIPSNTFRTLEGLHDWSVKAVAFSPDGTTLASASTEILLWDPTAGTQVRAINADQGIITALGFSPDGHILASGSNRGILKLWDVSTGACLKSLSGHPEGITHLDCSPDREHIVAASENCIRQWHIRVGLPLIVLDNLGENRVYNLAHSADGKFIVAVRWRHIITTWDARMSYVQRDDPPKPFRDGAMTYVAFSAGSNTLATSFTDHVIIIWDFETRKTIHMLPKQDGEIRAMAFSPDGKMFVSGLITGMVILYDVTSGAELRRVKLSDKPLCSLVFSPDGRTVAMGSADAVLRLWDI